MAYRVEKNRETGQPEIVIDGWDNGIAASPYEGITSIKNLNMRYLPGAVYSNYKRLLNTSASTITIPKYWTQDPDTGTYYIIDSSGHVWQSSDPSSVAWTQLTGNSGHTGGGQGIVVYKGYLFVFKDTSIDYYVINGGTWIFDWQTGLKSGVDHMALWVSGDFVVFCNGVDPSSLGTSTTGATIGLIRPNDVTMPFNPASNAFYNNAAVLLPGYESKAVWLTQLQTNIIIAAGKTLYQWDQVSPVVSATILPIKEDIFKVFNIMNLLYITAGYKGNIYISNGYSISPFVKIPDSFFGVIDPPLIPGDIMCHRNKLYVGMSQGLSPFINGVFSIDITTKVINFENQNSYGLNATGVTSPFGQPNVLIDLEAASIDTYASAWYNGTAGGMDKNDSTVYTGGETVIETDLIPVGTFLNPTTNINIEFKLDQPMSVSDSITIYGRQSFSDSYTEIGTTTNSATLSDVYTPLPLQKSQWLQFKIALTSGGASNFIRLREMRLR